MWRNQQSNGYGKLWSYEKQRHEWAHRISWELSYGTIPEGLFVLHHCDNPGCVRPEHLFLGTQGDNARDMSGKGRSGATVHPNSIERGVQRYCAKLDDDKVREIRKRFLSGEKNKDIADSYGVNPGTISNIVHGKKWKHVK